MTGLGGWRVPGFEALPGRTQGPDRAAEQPSSCHGDEVGHAGRGAYRAISRFRWSGVVGRVGLEPTTYGLKVRSSAN